MVLKECKKHTTSAILGYYRAFVEEWHFPREFFNIIQALSYEKKQVHGAFASPNRYLDSSPTGH